MVNKGTLIHSYDVTDIRKRKFINFNVFILLYSTFMMIAAFTYSWSINTDENMEDYLPALFGTVIFGFSIAAFLFFTNPKTMVVKILTNGIEYHYGPKPIMAKMHDFFIPFEVVKSMKRIQSNELEVRYYFAHCKIPEVHAQIVEEAHEEFRKNNKLKMKFK